MAPVPDAEWKRLVCLQVAALSWFSLGQPRGAPDLLRLGSKLSAAQWRAVNNLRRFCKDGNTPQLVDATKMGRAAAKFENSEEALAALARVAATLHDEGNAYFVGVPSKPTSTFERPFRCGFPSGFLKKGSMTTAKPLIAERLNFPGPPRFEPCRFFDDATAERYLHPLKCAEDHAAYCGEVPSVKIFADRKNLVEVYKKLATSGRLRPVEATAVRKGFLSGLFAVHKDAARDRLVLDGRPPNLLEPPQATWIRTMANPVAMRMLHLKPGHVLLSSGEDLRDYFYQFQVSKDRCERNTLVEPLTPDEVLYVFEGRCTATDPWTYVGLDSLAMGDSLACEFAQGSHIGLLLQYGICKSDQLLTLHGALPRGLVHTGVIVDDLVVLQQILESDLDALRSEVKETLGGRAVAAARAAYAAVNLEHNPKKGFQDELLASYWGVDMDGRLGVMRCSASRLWPAMMITMRVATLRLATVGLMASLAGTWVSLLGIRRRLFCLLDIIFEPLGLEDQSQVIRLSDALVDELVTVVMLAPLAMINLRAAYAPFLVATDASMTGLAGVVTSLTPAFTQELARHSLRKSTWATLLPPGKSWQKEKGTLLPDDELEDGTVYQVHPLWELCARGCKFKTTWSCKVKNPKHINLLEMDAHLREERRICKTCQSIRYPSALDSQVVLGALVKGRASATSLTTSMRRSLGYPLGNDLYSYYMFFPSWMNRADGPSRQVLPQEPDLPLPAWWDDALNGDFRRMDLWLQSRDEAQVERPIRFDLLMGKKDVDLKSGSMLKRQRREEPPLLSDDDAAGPGPEQASEPMVLRIGANHGPEQAAGSSLLPQHGIGSEQAVCPTAADAFSSHPESELQVTTPSTSRTSDFVSKRKSLLSRIPRRQFFPQTGDLDLESAGALDLFSGCFGVAKQMIRCGFLWVLTFELNRDEQEDLLSPSTQAMLMLLLELGAFITIGMAPVCASFSRAVTPAVRSAARPRGLRLLSHNMKKKVTIGNKLADFCRELWEKCQKLAIGFWVENPDTSFMWQLPGWEDFRFSDSSHVARLAFCRFGTCWRKNTRFGTNLAIAGLRMMCSCKSKNHRRLRGYSTFHKMQWTKLAEPYPRGVALLLAKACAVHAGLLNQDRLNIAGCCKSGSLRIGEASNPGPRPRHLFSRDTLESMPLLLPATVALERRLLNDFFSWCRKEITSTMPEEVFAKAPALMALVLRNYGDMMFQSGGALSNLRHLLLAAQRWSPTLKPHMQGPWEIVARWEKQQPVRHRTPMPESMVRAMCCLAWSFQWYAWAAATAVAFYGGSRVGELLKCSRADLLLPSDLAEDGVAPVFVRLRFFKSRNRTSAQVQHLRIKDETTCTLLRLLFRKLTPDTMLFDTNPYQYRKRWNLLLSALGIQDPKLFTPGGLRGGFAVAAYRAGMPVQDIMWAMRLRSQVTLESYLQEAASLSSLAALPRDARDAIASAAKVFRFLPASLG